eukprot:scaffold129926_cov18-Prasinocladus_malaysianus.AAC.1
MQQLLSLVWQAFLAKLYPISTVNLPVFLFRPVIFNLISARFALAHRHPSLAQCMSGRLAAP